MNICIKHNRIDPKETTFKELKSMVGIPDVQRLPSAKALKDGGFDILFNHDDEDIDITVFCNGYVIYAECERETVFSINMISEIMYRYSKNETVIVPESEFQDSSCLVPLLIYGNDRLEHNIESQGAYWRGFSLNNDGTDWTALRNTNSVEDDILEEEAKKVLKKSLSHLPKRQRQVLVLRFYDGYNSKEISQFLKISEPTVHEHLDSAIISVRQYAQNYF